MWEYQGGREREQERDRDRDRQTDRQTQTDRDRDRSRQREREREREKERQTDRQTDRDRERERERERDKDRDRALQTEHVEPTAAEHRSKAARSLGRHLVGRCMQHLAPSFRFRGRPSLFRPGELLLRSGQEGWPGELHFAAGVGGWQKMGRVHCGQGTNQDMKGSLRGSGRELVPSGVSLQSGSNPWRSHGRALCRGLVSSLLCAAPGWSSSAAVFTRR